MGENRISKLTYLICFEEIKRCKSSGEGGGQTRIVKFKLFNETEEEEEEECRNEFEIDKPKRAPVEESH